MSERVFERTNHHHGAFFVAGFAATGHCCPVVMAMVGHLHELMVQQ